MSTTNVLVLGGSGTGKTHYAGQLLGRLRHDRRGKLRIRPGGVDDLSKLEEVLVCLEEGRAAGHTPAETWTGIRCELETREGVRVLLEWPEYAGERLSSIVEQRLLPSEWRASIAKATGWLLFIRPSTLKRFEDILVRPTGVGAERPRPAARDDVDGGRGWDDRARYVELLQILMFAAGRPSFRRSQTPRLAIVFSCWDEVTEATTPSRFLAGGLPLLDAFIRSNWEDGAWSVWGLSSLGRALSQDECDPEFAARGPEKSGYVIVPDGTERDKDLTVPVAWLLGV